MASKHKLSPEQGQLGLSKPEPTLIIKSAPPEALLLRPITDEYDNDRAKYAGQRAKNRLGYYSLHRRNLGFSSKARPLWVPESAGENNAVVVSPEVAITWVYEAVKDRVREKHKDNPAKRGKLHRTAEFAARSAERALLSRYDGYSFEATQEMVRLGYAIDPDTGLFDPDLLEESPIAMEAAEHHLVKIEMFSGASANPAKPFKRKWLQKRWKWKIAEAHERAADYIATQSSENRVQLVDEAYQMEWSRKRYWLNFLKSYYREHPELKRKEREPWPKLKAYMDFSEPFFEIYDPQVVLERPPLPFDEV